MAKKGRVILVILALLHGTMHMYQAALSPLYLLIQNEFNVSFTELGLIGAVFTITGILQGVAGYFVDKFDWKKVTLMSVLVYTMAVFCFSISPSFLVLLVFIFIAGIGSTIFHPATYSLIAKKAPKEHLTKSMAYHQFGGFLGGAISTGLVAYLASYIGWRTTLKTISILGLMPILLFLFIVREEKMNKKGQSESRKDEGEFKISKPLLIIILATFFSSLGGSVGTFLPTFLFNVYGKSVVTAGTMTSVMQFVGCISLMAGGILADKFNKISIVFISYIFTGIATVVLSFGNFSSNILLIVLAFLGFSQFFGGPAMHAIFILLSPESARGRAIGLEFTCFMLGGVVASMLTGYLVDLSGFRFAFVICSIFKFIAGLILLIFIKERI